jgi:signal transduction histidine kinase
LTSYTQILTEGEHNLHFKHQHPDNLLFALQKEINGLAKMHSNQSHQQQSIERLLSHILDSWPVPVCLFDHKMKLRYRNNAMNEHLMQPMLINTPANELGFSLLKNKLVHPRFNDKWQCQSINFLQGKHENWLFSAINISQLLNYNQTVTQQNLIRVLGHELRNSLTPMASMTDTLLSNEHFEPKHVKIVLERIKKRSNRLLSFIGEYSQLTQLPPPKCQWFQFHDVYNEARTMQSKNHIDFHFIGEDQCFGDNEQIIQMLINLFKNALEASHQKQLKITVKNYQKHQLQVIEVIDNGVGFANFDNVLTPFYTTKNQGSGIGLALCAEIARNHNGELTVENNADQGAKISITWPYCGLQ